MPNDNKPKKNVDVTIEAGTPPQVIIVLTHAEDSNTLVSLEPTDVWVGASTLLRRVAGPNAPNDLVSA